MVIDTMNGIDIDGFLSWIWLSSIDGVWINYIWWCERRSVNMKSTVISISISFHFHSVSHHQSNYSNIIEWFFINHLLLYHSSIYILIMKSKHSMNQLNSFIVSWIYIQIILNNNNSGLFTLCQPLHSISIFSRI